MGIGASISTAIAGYVTEHSGFQAGFLFLATSALAALLLLWLAMPETKTAEPAGAELQLQPGT